MIPLRAKREFWTNEMESARTLGVALDNPRRPDEMVLQYAERVAILSGLMPAGRAAFDSNLSLSGYTPEPDRLPYREDFE